MSLLVAVHLGTVMLLRVCVTLLANLFLSFLSFACLSVFSFSSLLRFIAVYTMLSTVLQGASPPHQEPQGAQRRPMCAFVTRL